MLLRWLFGILTWIVVQVTAHEIAILETVLTAAAKFDGLVDLLLIGQVKMRLGSFEVTEPLFQLPNALLQESTKLLIVGVLFD